MAIIRDQVGSRTNCEANRMTTHAVSRLTVIWMM